MVGALLGVRDRSTFGLSRPVFYVYWMGHVGGNTGSVAEGGMCAHVWEMPLTRFERYSVATYVAAPVYQMCNGFTKLSLLIVYMQLSPQKWFRIAAWFSIVVVALYTSVITLLMFFHCHPIRRAFDFTLQTGYCLDAGILYMATAVSNIITDVMLFVLPTPMIIKLKMSKRQKIACVLIFGIGSLTVATSVVRLVYLPGTLKSSDISWDAAPANVWTFVEGNLFVICGSIPTMRRFFSHFFPNIFGTSVSTSHDQSRSHPHTDTAHSWSRKRNNKQYVQFPEAIDLQSFQGSAEQRKNAPPLSSTAVVTSDGDVDSHSERAILQTKSYTVHSEQSRLRVKETSEEQPAHKLPSSPASEVGTGDEGGHEGGEFVVLEVPVLAVPVGVVGGEGGVDGAGEVAAGVVVKEDWLGDGA
ncbi:hypothetical protein V500_05555 [Pseudogymnoascus sp. VKM F-4518 (FW-2643)]|nr:hypothetical protein V500_05555 [Pseudogymnoascus sp. VKM F-4518 (FW-2643)]